MLLSPSPAPLHAVSCNSTSPLAANATLHSPNKTFKLRFTDGGRLLVIEGCKGAAKPLWSAGPASVRSCSLPLSLQVLPGGALAITDKHGKVLWHSGTSCMTASSCYSYSLTVGGLVQTRLIRPAAVLDAAGSGPDRPVTLLQCLSHPPLPTRA